MPLSYPNADPGAARAGSGPLRRSSAIASRRGYCDWTVDHAGWVVMLLSPEEETFYGKTLEEALAWCLVWLMAPELVVRSVAVKP
jgi:hypothetical protein